MKTRTSCALLALACLPLSGLAQTYIGFGAGKADYSDFTLRDMEWDSLNVTQQKDKPTAFGLYVGERLNDYLAVELGYMNLGDRKISGYVTGGGNTASLDGKTRLEGLGLSVLGSYRIGGFAPYVRLGLMYGHQDRKVNKSDPGLLFSNPNNESSTTDVVRPIYGLGVEYEFTEAVAVRLDHTVIHHASVDTINNIDNGTIRRDVSITTLGLRYSFGDKTNKSLWGDSKWSMGLAGGWSKTSARLSGGGYNGNVWDLQSHTVNAQVAGGMSDDKTDTAYRLSLFRNEGSIEYEVYLATLGEFQSRSANNGIIGGGNALTGATTRAANALGGNVGYRFEPINSLSIQPKLGLAAVHTRDEIYNNLDFAGVGGSAHGPVVRKTVLSPTAGLVIGYQLTKSIEARLGYEHYFLSGSDAALGKGHVGTVLAGVRIGL